MLVCTNVCKCCVFVCTYVLCMYAYARMMLCMYVLPCVRTYVRMCERMFLCMYVFSLARAYVCMYASTYGHVREYKQPKQGKVNQSAQALQRTLRAYVEALLKTGSKMITPVRGYMLFGLASLPPNQDPCRRSRQFLQT